MCVSYVYFDETQSKTYEKVKIKEQQRLLWQKKKKHEQEKYEIKVCHDFDLFNLNFYCYRSFMFFLELLSFQMVTGQNGRGTPSIDGLHLVF